MSVRKRPLTRDISRNNVSVVRYSARLDNVALVRYNAQK